MVKREDFYLWSSESEPGTAWLRPASKAGRSWMNNYGDGGAPDAAQYLVAHSDLGALVANIEDDGLVVANRRDPNA